MGKVWRIEEGHDSMENRRGRTPDGTAKPVSRDHNYQTRIEISLYS